MIRAMILEPGRDAEVRFICPKKINELVGGCPEFTDLHEGICIAVNEEGKIKGLPLNRSLSDDDGNILDIFAGTMVLLSCNTKGEIGSLTDEQVVFLLAEFGEPETPDDWVDDDIDFIGEELHRILDEMIEKLLPGIGSQPVSKCPRRGRGAERPLGKEETSHDENHRDSRQG